MTDAPDSTARVPRRRPRQQISSMQIVFAAILSLGLLLVINFSGRIARGQYMDSERDRLQGTIDVLQQQRVELIKERDYASSDAYVERWAHNESKLVRDGEILVIPIPAGNVAPTPAPAPVLLVPTPRPKPDNPSWRLWWNLFFDGQPPF